MKKNIKKMFTLISVITLLCNFNTSLAIAGENHLSLSDSEINSFFEETGMSNELIDSMDSELKRYIYETQLENTSGETLIFEGCDKQLVSFDTQPSNELTPMYIPPNELALSVYGFSTSDGNYHMYPTFEWLTFNKLKNDTFAVALPYGWELVTNTYRLDLWCRVNTQNNWSYTQTFSRPSASHFYGYAITFPNLADAGLMMRGAAYI